MGFAEDQASNEFYLPSSDRWADVEDSQDIGTDPGVLLAVWSWPRWKLMMYFTTLGGVCTKLLG